MDALARPAPDGAFFAPQHDETLWSAPPWITGYAVSDSDGEKLVEVWLRPPRASEIAGIERVLRPLPDRPHDLEVYNAGSAPPVGFWHFHPRVEAFEIEYDIDDDSAWWVRLWLRPREDGQAAS